MLVELRIPNLRFLSFIFFLRYGKRASDRLSFFWSGLNGLDLTPASNCLVFFFTASFRVLQLFPSSKQN